MHKIKVLFLIPTLGGGGAERVLVNLVNGMNKNTFDITLQTLFKAGINSSFLDKDIKLKEGKIKQFSGNVLLMKLFTPSILYKFFIKEKYDVIISYLEGVTARILSGCSDASIKKISWLHTVYKDEAESYYCFRSKAEALKCYESFDKMVYVSRDVMKEFLNLYPRLKKNKVIYNTNDDVKIRKLAEESLDDVSLSEVYNIVTVGRLIQLKGFERLIDVHHKLKKNGIKNHLYILGTGELHEKLRQKIVENGDERTVHLLGFCKNPYKVIARCDVFVCSSFREGFSTAVTEALILGIPVVTTCVSGAYEQLGKCNDYGIVTPNSADGLYEGFKTLLDDKSILHQYKNQAQIRGKYFSKENSVKSVEDLIGSLCS